MINGLQTIVRIVDFLEHEKFQITYSNRYRGVVIVKFWNTTISSNKVTVTLRDFA